MWRKTWKRDFVIIGVISILVGIGIASIRSEPQDPDRARFLLECQYDWMLSNEACHRLLDGGDPPEEPPEYLGC